MLRIILNPIARFTNFLLNQAQKKTKNDIDKLARVDAHAAVLARTRLKKKRRLLTSMFYILEMLLTGALAIGLVVGIVIGEVSPLNIILSIILAICSLGAFVSLFQSTGNISVLETSDVIGCNTPYALYLRAFESDYRRRVFKEEDVVQTLLDQQVITFAVGLPEEIDASPGAQRVYVNNDTWQEEVSMMMNHATYLFLRICDTEPCLWEVMHALSLNKELYIIIDNAEEYSTICNKCDVLPKDISLNQGMYVIYKRLLDGTWEKQSLGEVDNDSSYEVDEDSSYEDDYKEIYTEGLLERFPMLFDAEIYQYENSIEGLFSNLYYEWDIQYTNPVVERIIELIDAYYSNFNEEDDDEIQEEFTLNIQNYLDKLRRIHPLSDQLMKRREELFDKVGFTG